MVRDLGFGRVPLPSSICGFHLWVQSLCHFHPMIMGKEEKTGRVHADFS